MGVEHEVPPTDNSPSNVPAAFVPCGAFGRLGSVLTTPTTVPLAVTLPPEGAVAVPEMEPLSDDGLICSVIRSESPGITGAMVALSPSRWIVTAMDVRGGVGAGDVPTHKTTDVQMPF